MTEAEIRSAIFRALTRIAPEIEPATIRPDVRIRDQVDIDSMDFLNFVIGLDRELGVDVQEADYDKLATLDAAVAYLRARLSP